MSLPKKSPNKTCRCGQSKKPQQLLCRVCWSFLPKPLRAEVAASYKEKPGSERHLTAIRACFRHLNSQSADHHAEPQ